MLHVVSLGEMFTERLDETVNQGGSISFNFSHVSVLVIAHLS